MLLSDFQKIRYLALSRSLSLSPSLSGCLSPLGPGLTLGSQTLNRVLSQLCPTQFTRLPKKGTSRSRPSSQTKTQPSLKIYILINNFEPRSHAPEALALDAIKSWALPLPVISPPIAPDKSTQASVVMLINLNLLLIYQCQWVGREPTPDTQLNISQNDSTMTIIWLL